jgi:hypothetical protein
MAPNLTQAVYRSHHPSMAAEYSSRLSYNWSQYIVETPYHLFSTQYLLGVALLVPVVAIVLNAVWQVVSLQRSSPTPDLISQELAPRSPSDPPVIFHWLPIVGSAIAYGDSYLEFLFACREKVIACQFNSSVITSINASPTVRRCFHLPALRTPHRRRSRSKGK